jgi:hypothetical protein
MQPGGNFTGICQVKYKKRVTQGTIFRVIMVKTKVGSQSVALFYCGDKDMTYRTIPSVKTSFDLSSKRLNAFFSTGEVMQWKPEDDTSLYINL